MLVESMLTTTDNPHDPFDDFNAWYSWDSRHGYHTMDYLARVVASSNEISETDQSLAIEHGIDEIVDENVNGMYKKISREVPKVNSITGTKDGKSEVET